MPKVRVDKRGVIVIPKEIREKLGIKEGSVLELVVEGDRIVIKTTDLWSELRRRVKKPVVNTDGAEKELDKDDELWLRRLGQQ